MAQTREVAGPAITKSPARTWGYTGLAAVAPMTWGTTYLVTTEYLPPGVPLGAGVIRALPAGLLLLLISRTLPRGDWWWRSAVLGALNIGALFALLFVAAYRLPGGVAGTLSAVQPLLVAGIAFVLLGVRPTRWQLGWGVAGVVGVGLIVLRGQISFDPIGILAGLGGAASMAVGVVLTKRWGRPPGVGTLAFTSWQLTAGGLLLAPVALAVEGLPPAPDAAALGGYAWLAVVATALAHSLWFQGVGRLPVTAVSFLTLLSPAVAAALGWLVLDESLTPLQGVGFVLALLSIAAAQLTPDAARSLIRGNPGAPR
ncbi:EamA family transporter [Embleya scabrispora]|uniref:EamA family transporter n=1 Tax=Embleya scabrispora TaxID=159449 RepID=UPI000367A33A|nr:EamA family transporter [Embleya scabrispora]MYS86095.1 EamA family transporter [Streptomyces sp. SID5474]